MNPRALWRRFADGPDPRPRRVAQGLVLGLMAHVTASLVGIGLPWKADSFTPLVHVLVGVVAMTGAAWLRRVYWCLLGLLVTVTTLVGATPLAPALLARLAVDDHPASADVIVVLSGSTLRTGLNVSSQDRLLHGLKLLHDGVAPVIVCTAEPPNPLNQFDFRAAELMLDLGLDTSRLVAFEWPGWSPMNTRKEGLAIAAMAERHGWRRVLVVTSASHTRRSRAVFRTVGLDAQVTVAPSALYPLYGPTDAGDRFQMCRALTYEVAALAVYRLRGWI